MTQTFTSFSDFKKRYPIRANDDTMLLGSGSYGKVIKVEDQLETEWVAIKISEFKGDDSKSLQAEINLAKAIPRQTNIARYDACYRLETDTSLSDFAVMKYYQDGNLATLLKNERLTKTQVYDLTKGILLGLQHLHQNRIVHRDFKPANILISRDNGGRLIPKIADFGLSKLVGNDEIDSSDFDLSDGRGTPSYKAPEQIEGSRVSFNLDLWAFGVILYEIMLGEKPFNVDVRAVSEQAARRAVELKIIGVELPDKIRHIPEPYQQIIRRCLVRDIHRRARKESELLDLLDNIPALLKEAQAFESQGNYDEARTLYEQILRCSPDHVAATRGRASCIDKSRPTIVEPAVEQTDVYVKKTAPVVVDLPTDVYAPTTVAASVSTSVKRPVSLPVYWKYAFPAAVAVGGIGLFVFMHFSSQKDAKTGVTGGPVRIDSTNSLPKQVGTTTMRPAPASTVLKANRTNVVALVRVMQGRGDGKEAKSIFAAYNRALTGTPAQQMAVLQRMKSLSKTYATPVETVVLTAPETTTKAAAPTATMPAPPTTAAAKQEPPVAAKADPPKPDPAEVKKAAQDEYENLIDKGTVLIANGNNKPGAIAQFNEARQLASKHDLNTAKAHEKYAQYFSKGNRILDSDDYDGAKPWFLVAQSLENTTEVRAKIKICNNQ